MNEHGIKKSLALAQRPPGIDSPRHAGLMPGVHSLMLACDFRPIFATASWRLTSSNRGGACSNANSRRVLLVGLSTSCAPGQWRTSPAVVPIQRDGEDGKAQNQDRNGQTERKTRHYQLVQSEHNTNTSARFWARGVADHNHQACTHATRSFLKLAVTHKERPERSHEHTCLLIHIHLLAHEPTRNPNARG